MATEEGASLASPALEDLAGAVSRFASRSKEGRTQTDLAVELIQLRKLSDRLELEFAETAVAFAATSEYEEWGSANPYDWIRHNCQMNYGPVGDRINVGEQMAKLPESVAAMKDGQIGFAHLAVIARTAVALVQSGKTIDEHAVVDLARQHSVGKLWRLCQHIRHAADSEAIAEQLHDAVEARYLRLSPRENGVVFLGGQVDAVGGAALRTALESLSHPSGADDNRDYHRRLADALVELATHALDAGKLPRKGGQRPHLMVSTSLDTLRGLAGSAGADMEFCIPISSKTVQRMACDTTIVRVLLAADSTVIDVGRAKRVVSNATRRAVYARDDTCRWPGCERPKAWTNVHHVVHWAHGGRTDLSNLVLLCERHHNMVHEGGWELIGDPDGRLTAITTLSRWSPWSRGPDPAQPLAA